MRKSIIFVLVVFVLCGGSALVEGKGKKTGQTKIEKADKQKTSLEVTREYLKTDEGKEWIDWTKGFKKEFPPLKIYTNEMITIFLRDHKIIMRVCPYFYTECWGKDANKDRKSLEEKIQSFLSVDQVFKGNLSESIFNFLVWEIEQENKSFSSEDLDGLSELNLETIKDFLVHYLENQKLKEMEEGLEKFMK